MNSLAEWFDGFGRFFEEEQSFWVWSVMALLWCLITGTISAAARSHAIKKDWDLKLHPSLPPRRAHFIATVLGQLGGIAGLLAYGNVHLSLAVDWKTATLTVVATILGHSFSWRVVSFADTQQPLSSALRLGSPRSNP